ncbi:MAG: 16S rRNA (uracil(1498)-N(3))-methyltransferase [Deltaproteobacteria bacterium]|nr:16S rRNA (uracil(1498)-N(3))-methyltransferase [Candidatus Zymogenaceae bacterium]
MSRIFVEGRLSVGAIAVLEPAQVHYLRNVLRLSSDDVVTLVDEAGREFRAQVLRGRGKDMTLAVVEELDSIVQPRLFIHLFAGLMKGKKMERLVRDAAALGVQSLTPFVSSRTVPKDIGDMKLERMKKIALEESRLSGRNQPLLVCPPATFAKAVRSRADLSLFLWEEETTDIRDTLKARRTAPTTVSLYTGPEGGFSAEEAALAAGEGLVPVGLGRRIIRAETAPLVAAVIVQYEWGDL